MRIPFSTLILLGILASLHAYIGWRILPVLPLERDRRADGAPPEITRVRLVHA